MILVTVQQYFLVLLFLVITWTIFCRYVLDLVDIYHEYYSIFFILYSYLKRMKHFLNSSFSIQSGLQGKVEIVIFIVTKSPWLWLSSYLTWSLVGKHWTDLVNDWWVPFCFLMLKAGFQQAIFCVFDRCSLGRPVRMLLSAKVYYISAELSMLKGSLWIHIVVLRWVQFEKTDFCLEIGNF